MHITAFLPCRLGSQRIIDKNLRKFSNYQHGLLEIKLEQLYSCSRVDEIIVSSNDCRVLDYSEEFKSLHPYKKITIDVRPEHLGNSDTSTDCLINYVADRFDFEHLLWTHVTSPFVNSDDYSKCIKEYELSLNKGFDSLMTVQSLQGFIWDEVGAISYDRTQEKWPRTQSLKKLYEVDSAIFIASQDTYKKQRDRIGKSPKLVDLRKIFNIDIDWPEQFLLAEAIFSSQQS